MFSIVPIETPTLGDRSYLVHDGEVALVVDPQRDIDRVLALADAAGVRITHVFETHIHNDYVTGGLALAKATGAAYHVNAADDVAYQRVPVNDGDVIDVSDVLRIRVIATPGHTYTHLSYSLESGSEHVGVFSGGSLLFGSTGRPDLLGPDHTHALVHHQFASAHRLATELPDQTQVLPTHGFGSFCAATESEGDLVHDRSGAAHQPGPHQGRERLRRRPARRSGCLAGVLRPDGPGQLRGSGRGRPECS